MLKPEEVLRIASDPAPASETDLAAAWVTVFEWAKQRAAGVCAFCLRSEDQGLMISGDGDSGARICAECALQAAAAAIDAYRSAVAEAAGGES